MSEELFNDPTAVDEKQLEFTAPDDTGISALTKHARRQLELEMLIESAEDLVSRLKREHQNVSQTIIPKIMQDLGVAEIKLTDGSKVTVSPFYAGKITSEAGYEWLKKEGHGSIVKAVFEVSYDFSASEEELESIQNKLSETGLTYVEKKSVHHMTLGAFIKEQELAETPVPHDLFNVFTGYKTKIK